MPEIGQRDAKHDALNRVSSRAEACQHAAELPNPPPSEAGLSIVIPAYNALGTVEPLLEQLVSLPEVESRLYEVIITDDASTDGTIAALRQRYPQFVYIESERNTGFGLNANRGIARADKGYTALVNTDIELVGNPFEALVKALSEQPGCFALMPLVYNTARRQIENLQTLSPSRGLVWNSDLPEAALFTQAVQESIANRSLDQLLSSLIDSKPTKSILCGACFVCGTQALRQLGGFDEQFSPFYWEDVDLGFAGCHARGGGSCPAVAILPSALVLHRHSESINKVHGERKLHFLRINQLRFCCKWREQLKLPGARWWLFLRGLRECFGGDPVLRRAYFLAALGAKEV